MSQDPSRTSAGGGGHPGNVACSSSPSVKPSSISKTASKGNTPGVGPVRTSTQASSSPTARGSSSVPSGRRQVALSGLPRQKDNKSLPTGPLLSSKVDHFHRKSDNMDRLGASPEITTIIVKSESTDDQPLKLSIHRTLLVSMFAYFERAYRSNSLEAQTGIFELKGDSTVWKYIQNWLYTGTFAYPLLPRYSSSELLEQTSRRQQGLLIKIYTCAAQLIGPARKDACISELARKMRISYSVPADAEPIRAAFEEVPWEEGHRLCRFLSRSYPIIFKWECARFYANQNEEVPERFLRGLLSTLADQEEKGDAAIVVKICDYHEHGSPGECPFWNDVLSPRVKESI